MHKSYLQVAEWGNIMFLYGLSSLTRRRDAYALLQTALHQIYGLSELPELKQQERGKPYFPQYPSIHFNLSHSGPFALCGISDQPIGVDIQVLRPFRPTLMERSCSDHELAWLYSRGMQHSDFALLWVLKESIGKYTGYGLPYPPSRLSVPIPPLGQSFTMDTVYPYQNLLCRVYTESTWCAAVCASQTPSKEIVWI